MTIKQHGGVFGRNPTFNDVTIEGDVTLDGTAIPDPGTILVDADIGSTVQGYDADTAKYDDATANFTGTLQEGGNNVVTANEVGTIASQDANSVNIDGGAIDGTAIGANSASTGKFTSLAVGATVPSDIHATWSQSFFGAKGSIISEIGAGGVPGMYVADNIYLDVDTGTFSYLTTNEASAIRCEGGQTIFYYAGSGTAGTTASLAMAAKFNTSGNLEFTSGKGIDFSATAGTGTSELFDDYEEGYHTVVATGSTSGTAGFTSGNNEIAYTKVGNLVHVSGYLYFSSVSSLVGNLQLSLPFTAADLTDGGGFSAASFRFQNVVSANCADFLGYTTEGSDLLTVVVGDGTTVSASAAEIKIATQVFLSLTYKAA